MITTEAACTLSPTPPASIWLSSTACPSTREKAQSASNPHLAIEALRALLLEESGHVTRNNLVRQHAFSERLTELMRKYTNQQLTSAEVIAELIEPAKEGTACRPDRRRGLISWCG
jgi:hypothetical protein